ncbi:zinc ABC transporter substrate-binding protein [Acetobacter sp. TBRC 12305]|uniref:Zinc ABC transporter substrate-binding protein n=2 Tax=Acetobacter garciniae TaxID=2817435 RepID=A0A939HIV2_9PROT|nr:zinc ABC transporter substrate-binding protein [Acetobacter garciniae]MBX0344793.1 zinc ABC transporter substrate-binding protein [Acetobacter garciniae]
MAEGAACAITRALAAMLAAVLLASLPGPAGGARAATRPSIVAAENSWGDLAAQVAGPDMAVTTLLASPIADPHVYEPTPDDARHIADATLVVANGAGYDGWVDRLVAAAGLPAVRYVRADSWPGWRDGGNPHLWFDLDAAAAFVRHVATACQQADPAHASAYATRAADVLASIDTLAQTLQALRARVGGQHIAATEPLFAPLAERMGLVMEENAYQLAIMNGVEPAPAAIAAFETDLAARKLRLVAYNQQVVEPSVERILDRARAAHVPLLPLTETMPAGQHWQGWVRTTVEQAAHLLETAP